MVNVGSLPQLSLHGTPLHGTPLIQTPSLLHTPSPTLSSSVYDVMQKFLSLINTDQLIQVLMQCDSHNQVIDKWLVAIVFEYFQRANLMMYQYTRERFFIALYLAIEFEEDEDRKVKDVLLDYLLHHDNILTSKRQFIKKKDKYWKKLGFMCMVTRRRLEQIIAIDPYHSVWQRERKESQAGANRSFTCKLDPPSFYKFQWSIQQQQPPQIKREPQTISRDQPMLTSSEPHSLPSELLGQQLAVARPPKTSVPEIIDLTKDSPAELPVPMKPQERKRTSLAYRHLHSIVTLIARDRGRRRPPHDFLKIKHAQQKRLNEVQMLESLGRTNSFNALNTELAHLNVNQSINPAAQSCLNQLQLPQYPFLYNPAEGSDFTLPPGLLLLPDRRLSFPLFNLEHLAGGVGVPSPNLPMVVPVLPRTDHWV